MQIFKNSSNFYFLKGESEYYLSLKKDAVTSYYRSLELEPLSNSIAAERILELTGKRPPSKLENLETDRIPFTSDNNLMFIEALVNNRLGLFLVDTGASGCVLFSNQLEKYRMKTGTSKIEAETAGGTIQARIAFGRVQVGKHIVEPIMFVVTPPPKSMRADGIIGMNFLNRFQMDINRDTQVITLKR
jgi:clan AA aspartic protease (TIGR02281 family)